MAFKIFNVPPILFYSNKKAENVKTGQQQGCGMFKAMLHISKHIYVCGYILFSFISITFFFFFNFDFY